MSSAISSSTAIKPSYLPTATSAPGKPSSKGGDGDGDHGQEVKVSAPPAVPSNTPSSSGTLGTLINTQA